MSYNSYNPFLFSQVTRPMILNDNNYASNLVNLLNQTSSYQNISRQHYNTQPNGLQTLNVTNSLPYVQQKAYNINSIPYQNNSLLQSRYYMQNNNNNSNINTGNNNHNNNNNNINGNINMSNGNKHQNFMQFPVKCDVCDIICNSQTQWDMHLNGKKHIKQARINHERRNKHNNNNNNSNTNGNNNNNNNNTNNKNGYILSILYYINKK